MTFEEARRSSLKVSLVIGQVQKVTVARDENFAINPVWSCCIFLVVGIISCLCPEFKVGVLAWDALNFVLMLL